MFKGSLVAIVTPFKNGKIDEKKFKELIEFQIENGTDGIVPVGCTGEAATLAHEEQKHLMKFVCGVVNKRVPVVCGAGSNSTAEAITLTKYAKKSGCDGVLSITPYYNKPTQDGVYQHFVELSKIGIPLIAYNIEQNRESELLIFQHNNCGIRNWVLLLTAVAYYKGHCLPLYSGRLARFGLWLSLGFGFSLWFGFAAGGRWLGLGRWFSLWGGLGWLVNNFAA